MFLTQVIFRRQLRDGNLFGLSVWLTRRCSSLLSFDIRFSGCFRDLLGRWRERRFDRGLYGASGVWRDNAGFLRNVIAPGLAIA